METLERRERHISTAKPIPRPHWRTVIVRVTEVAMATNSRGRASLMLAGTTHDIARDPEAQEAIRLLAEGELTAVTLGRPRHTIIERAE